MSFSEKDWTITVSVRVGAAWRRHVLRAHKDATVDFGDSAAQQIGGGNVAFISEGANKPKFSVNVIDAIEAAQLRALLVDGATGKKRECRVSLAGRRDGRSLAYRMNGGRLSAGLGLKLSDGEGAASDKTMEILGTSAEVSINGAPYTRAA